MTKKSEENKAQWVITADNVLVNAIRRSVNEIKIFPFASAEQDVLQHDVIITEQPDVLIFDDHKLAVSRHRYVLPKTLLIGCSDETKEIVAT